MNTYDPSDRIVYLHLSGPADARPTTTAAPSAARTATPCAPLPAGYANQSPRTRLQRRPSPVRPTPPRTAALVA